MMNLKKSAIGMIILAFASLILITGFPFQIANNRTIPAEGPDGRAGDQIFHSGHSMLPGPQGERELRGMTGPAGPASTIPGPQGSPGVTFLNGTNLYRIIGPVEIANNTKVSAISFAKCDSGDTPVNGLSLITGKEAKLAVTGTSTGDFANSVLPTGYITQITDVEVGDSVQSFVTCFDNPPLRP